MRALVDIVRGFVLMGGAGLVSYGAWLAWEPSGFIVGGGLLLVGFWLDAKGREA